MKSLHSPLMSAFKDAREGLVASLETREGWSDKSVSREATAHWRNPKWDGKWKGVTRLRLDYELPYDQLEPLSDRQSLSIMFWDFNAAYNDLHDLLVNGDVNEHRGDALLKSFDGQKVRGKDLKETYLAEVVVFKEIKPRKETTEWTAYLLLFVEWED